MASIEARTRARLKSIYAGQKRRAKKHGETLSYTADELIAHCLPLMHPGCPYCGVHLTPKGFQIDHIEPIAREGTWTLSNTHPVCTPCNRRKNALTHAEYVSLLEFLKHWMPEYARKNILSRLAAGGAWLASRF